MNNLQVQTSPEVESVFQQYPDGVRDRILNLRRLILEAAHETEEVRKIEETLKWGEPSYLVKNGSTIRIDWKENKPDQYAMYFKCTSRLIPTFKTVYPDRFTFEGNRAIVFHLNDELPETELRNCIKAGLRYHKVKQLPRLGMERMNEG